MMEQVRLCDVWPKENWLGSSLNQIQGGTAVRESYYRALEQGPLAQRAKGGGGQREASAHMELGRFSVDRNGRSFAEFFSQDTLTKSTSKVGPGELSLISCLSLGLQPRPSQFIGSPSHPASTPFPAIMIASVQLGKIDVPLSIQYQACFDGT